MKLDANFLFASLPWGSVDTGYLIYVRKQREIVPVVSGGTMITGSYSIGYWFWMSLACLALMAAVYWLVRRGY